MQILERNQMANRKDSKGRVLKSGESQRKNGSYEFKFTDNSGKRRSVYAKDLKTLREKEKEVQKGLEAGLKFTGKNITLEEMIQKYLELPRAVKSSTQRTNEGRFMMVKKFQICQYKIKDITIADCKAFAMQLNRHYTDGTTKVLWGLCRVAMDYALESNMILHNPFRSVSKIPLMGKALPKGAFTDKEFDEIIKTMNDSNVYRWYIPHFNLLRETGLRISEMAGLRIQDIDFENRLLYINQQYLEGKGGYRYYSSLKTKESQACIPLSDVAIEAIHKIIEQNEGRTLSFSDENDENELSGFFVLGKSGVSRCATNWETTFRGVQRLYNRKHPDKPIRIHPHKLRHTTVTRLLKHGLSVPATQKMIRHADASTTLNIYTHINTEDLLEEFNQLDLTSVYTT